MKSKLLCFSTLLLLTACNNSSDSPPAADTPGGTFDISAETAPAVVAAPDPDRDMPLEDKTFYGLKGGDSVELGQVSEATSLMHHSMKIGGKDVKFTARAGHLIAYKPAAADGANDPQAAIFYTSYTRDDLPRENRPVTFFWNGGPGSSSKFLHLGSWAPKRMVINPPVIPPEYFEKDQPTFPVVDDAETLLDQSDLVFVDPVGTGFSSAIAPHKNEDFWGIDSDPKVLRDFITRYINTYNRQSSPKYLYGESYGGIRTPITARLLLEAGSANYLPDSSGKPPVALSGIVLQSPVLDYNSSCALGSSVSCEGLLPTYAATADYYGLLPARGKRSLEDFLVDVRAFGATSYRRVQHDIIGEIANPSEKTPQEEFLERLRTLDLREDFIHRSDARKEELLKAVDALAPTPLKAILQSVGSAVSPLVFTKYCIQQAEVQNTASKTPAKPVAVDVDFRPYKRLPLSAKEVRSAQQDMKNLIADFAKKKEYNLTETLVKSGVFFDYLTDLVSASVEINSLQPFETLCNPVKSWSDYVSSPAGETFLKSLHAYTGLRRPTKILDSGWLRHPDMGFETFLDKLLPGYSFNVYDARMSVPGMNYDPGFADTSGGNAAMAGLLPGFVGYINRTAPYMGLNHHVILSWDWTPDPDVKFSTSRLRTSIPDLIESLTLKSDLKVLVLHGYTDLVTPFHQTELDLENAKLADRIPVKNFEGGHMTYSNEGSRAPMKAVLDQFYAGTLGGPGTGFASNPPMVSPAPLDVNAPSEEMAPVAAFLDGVQRINAEFGEYIKAMNEAMALNLVPTGSIEQSEILGKTVKALDATAELFTGKPELALLDPAMFEAKKDALKDVSDKMPLIKGLTATAKGLINDVKRKQLTQHNEPVQAGVAPVTLSQQDRELLEQINKVLVEFNPADDAAINDLQLNVDINVLRLYVKNPASFNTPASIDKIKATLAKVTKTLEAKEKAPASVQKQTPPSAVLGKPESKETQDKNKSTGSVAPVPSNVPPVGALQVPLPVVDPGKSGPKEQPVTQDNNKSTGSSASELSKHEEDNIKERDSLIARAGKVKSIYTALLEKHDLSVADKVPYAIPAAKAKTAEDELNKIDMKKDNTALFKSYEDSLVKQEADAQKALADQKAPPPAPKPPVVPVSNPGTLH